MSFLTDPSQTWKLGEIPPPCMHVCLHVQCKCMILPASVLNLCTKANPKFLTFNEEIHILALYIDVGAPSIQLLIEKVSQGCFAESVIQEVQESPLPA